MSPPGPVDIAAARRKADREEIARAKETGDWAIAFDVLHANLHEVEGLVVRGLNKHDAANALLENLLVRVGELVEKLEHPPVPSYRPTAASANQLDAQALGQSIESVYAELSGSQSAIVTRVVALESAIGAPPDEIKGAKGTGIAGIVHRLNSKATLAKLALLAALASALGTNAGEFVRWLLHAAAKG